MKTLTMDIDDTTWSRAQKKASELATSVDDVVATYLQQWVDSDAIDQSRRKMTALFAKPDWDFTVGTPDSREQRNARRRVLPSPRKCRPLPA